MSNYRRPFLPGATWFFTVVTYRRSPILCETKARQALRDAVHYVRGELPFKIGGWVLLPDHMHCIWTLPEGDAGIEKRWGLIKARVTRRLNTDAMGSPSTPSRDRRHEGNIWQRRFWEHAIRDDDDLSVHLDYLHFNPVKHGYVTSAGDWPWSSLHRHVRMGTYPAGWAGVSAEAPGTFGE